MRAPFQVSITLLVAFASVLADRGSEGTTRLSVPSLDRTLASSAASTNDEDEAELSRLPSWLTRRRAREKEEEEADKAPVEPSRKPRKSRIKKKAVAQEQDDPAETTPTETTKSPWWKRDRTTNPSSDESGKSNSVSQQTTDSNKNGKPDAASKKVKSFDAQKVAPTTSSSKQEPQESKDEVKPEIAEITQTRNPWWNRNQATTKKEPEKEPSKAQETTASTTATSKDGNQNATSTETSQSTNTTAVGAANALPPPAPPTSPGLSQQLQLQQQLQTQQPMLFVSPSHRPNHPVPARQDPRSVIAVAGIASALTTLAKLFFLTWLTRTLASEMETVHPTQHFVFEVVNHRYNRDAMALRNALHVPPRGVAGWAWRPYEKSRRRYRTPRVRLRDKFPETVIVVELMAPDGSMDMTHLTDMVNFLLLQHREHAFGTNLKTQGPKDLEIVLLLKSPGGAVGTYGLAASQINRLSQEEGITTTVCVDNYAASGGYMIASQAHLLIAAPFASVGSIGVISQGLNFNKLMTEYGIKPLVVKAGEHKASMHSWGEVTKEELAHEEERLQKVHEAFRALVTTRRAGLAEYMETACNGDLFLGQEALDLKLVDAVMTSEEYLFQKIANGDRVLKMHKSLHQSTVKRLLSPLLDVLPHLREKLEGSFGARVQAVQLVQLGTLMSFARHIYSVYFKSDP